MEMRRSLVFVFDRGFLVTLACACAFEGSSEDSGEFLGAELGRASVFRQSREVGSGRTCDHRSRESGAERLAETSVVGLDIVENPAFGRASL